MRDAENEDSQGSVSLSLQPLDATAREERAKTRNGFGHIGAFLIRIGFGGPLYKSYFKESQTSRDNYQGPQLEPYKPLYP